jgi:single-stranded-DNA-specific exonuclease
VIASRFRWRAPEVVAVDSACREIGRQRGISERLLGVLAARGVTDPGELERFLGPAEAGLHDPSLLPDADAALRRVAESRAKGERILVYGDFDADGLTGLAIMVLALRRLGLDAEPYVPERLGDGHGLSPRAIERAVAEGRTLIVTADCGTSSGPEIEQASQRGLDVLVTDHHHAASLPAAAVAVVNPWRPDSLYPDRQLTGAGVAWKLAVLLLRELEGGPSLPQGARELADLAMIGTVADVAPILGENRSIARLGLETLRAGARPGIAALMRCAGVSPATTDLDDIGFALAPRLNAAGRVGEAARAERLLLALDREEADRLATEIESANKERRELTRTAVAEARMALGLTSPEGAPPDATRADDAATTAAGSVTPQAASSTAPTPPAALLVRGEWPVGIVGLIAGRLTEELARPAVVATLADAEAGILRASCRAPHGFNLAEALTSCEDLLIRHGGHAAAAGFEIEAGRWPEFEARFSALAAAAVLPTGPRELSLDVVAPATAVDFAFVREMGLIAPTGPGNPRVVLGLSGLRVVRARPAAGGHTQLVLNRGRDVLDAIAFRRPDLATALKDGDRIDVAACASCRQFGGFESLQLEVLDVAAAGSQVAMSGGLPATVIDRAP